MASEQDQDAAKVKKADKVFESVFVVGDILPARASAVRPLFGPAARCDAKKITSDPERSV
ncbi:MAG TPA: hypothetical protein VMU16_07105 [Candidatus Binataceae bacterium]|nr:hypothetical protein [Candidatus Binataceae bacterium]